MWRPRVHAPERAAASRLTALALAAALVACGGDGPASPDDEGDGGVDVEVTIASFTGPSMDVDDSGEPVIDCEFTLRAQATGQGVASWRDATFRFFLGSDQRTPVDSTRLDASDIADSWQSSSIEAGAFQTAQWSVHAGIPFLAELEFRYGATGRSSKSSKVTFACTPPVSETAPAPTITTLSVVPPSGELPSEAPLTIDLGVSAPNGLWRTALTISGPCDVEKVFADRAAHEASRTLSLTLPPSCRLGEPITIAVEAMDVATRIARRELPTQIVLADKTPPSVYALFFPTGGGPGSDTPSLDVFAGDSINVLMNVGENHALEALVWEVLPYGERDSLLVSAAGISTGVFVKLKPEWSGPVQLRLFARDAVGLTSNVITTPPDSIRVRPTIERPTRTATVTGETREVAFDERRGVLYLAQGNDHRIAIVSMQTLQITGTVSLPSAPVDLDLSASGDSLLVVIGGRSELGIVDLGTATPAYSTLALGLDETVTQRPVNVRVGANGHAYVTVAGSTEASRAMLDVDLAAATRTVLTGAGTTGSTGAGILERSLDRSTLVLTIGDPWCTQRFVVATGSFEACTTTRVRDWRPSVDATGARYAVGLDVYDRSSGLLPRPGPFGVGIPPSALSADGTVLYVIDWFSGIVRRRADDGTIIDRTPNTINPWSARVSPSGSWLLSIESNYGATTKLSLIDLR